MNLQPEAKDNKNILKANELEGKKKLRSNKGLIVALIVLIVLALISISVAGYFYYTWQSDKVEQLEVQKEQVESAESQKDLSENNEVEVIEEGDIDTDKDGLTDSEEKELGTDPKKEDTDGDGYSDKDEIDSNNDPLSHSASVKADEYSQLQSTDLTYQGSFLLPNEFNWGARGLSYYPKGNNGSGSLLATGFEMPRNNNYEECTSADNCFTYYGEVEIPTPVKVSNYEDAPIATLQGSVRKLEDGRVAAHDYETTWISDIEYVPQRGTQTNDKIYASKTLWYAEGGSGTNTFPTIWFSNLNGSNTQGLFQVGPDEDPFHGRKMGDYLFSVPDWYANKYLGGRTLVTGRSRGTPGEYDASNTSAGSQGPTLFAFSPFNSDTASGNLDALPMLYYRTFFPECAGPNVGDKSKCDYPDFTMGDVWTGADFVEANSKSTIMIQGRKGLGTNCYDNADGNGTVCDDPCGGGGHGYHCNPYEREVIFYDVDKIGQIAKGEIDPWSVTPYEIWRPKEFFFQGQTCGDVGGMTYDEEHKKLYMVERGLGGFDNENRAAVHVYGVE
jgi:hypothetical protein